mgnify:CR=1 FL=1
MGDLDRISETVIKSQSIICNYLFQSERFLFKG